MIGPTYRRMSDDWPRVAGPSSILDGSVIGVTESLYDIDQPFPADFWRVDRIVRLTVAFQEVTPGLVTEAAGGSKDSRSYGLRLNSITGLLIWSPPPGPSLSTGLSMHLSGMFLFRCLAAGVAGKLAVSQAGALTADPARMSTVIQPVTIDTTIPQTIKFTQQFGLGSVGTSCLLTLMTEILT